MGIIASVILAAAYMFTPQTQTLEHVIEVPYTNEVSCLTRAEIMKLDELSRKVDILYAEYTNRLARVEARKAADAERKLSAVERVKENMKMRKRRSVMPKSAGGVK